MWQQHGMRYTVGILLTVWLCLIFGMPLWLVFPITIMAGIVDYLLG